MVIQFNTAFDAATAGNALGPQVVYGFAHFNAPATGANRVQISTGSGTNTDFFINRATFDAISWQAVARGDYVVID